MTIQEFDKTDWHSGMRVLYKGVPHPIWQIDLLFRRVRISFKEGLFESGHKWLETEEIQLVNNKL